MILSAKGQVDREGLLQRINAVLASAFPRSSIAVEAFGSFAMGISTQTGDMDLKLSGTTELRFHQRRRWTAEHLNSEPPSTADPPGAVDISDVPRNRSLDILQDAYVALSRQRGFFRSTKNSYPQTIFRARVPIIKFVENATGLECDVSLQSDGILKSKVLGVVLAMDTRVASLVRLVKVRGGRPRVWWGVGGGV